jgi:small subunit ribosomal protein S16
MLVIRLKRIGKKNQPSFKVIVTEKKKSAKGGTRIEELGFLNPLTKKISLNKERILYWMSKGAKESDTVHNLLVKNKILEGKKISVHKKSKKKQEGAAPANAPAAQAKPTEKTESAPLVPQTPVEKPAETPIQNQAAPAEKKLEKQPMLVEEKK